MKKPLIRRRNVLRCLTLVTIILLIATTAGCAGPTPTPAPTETPTPLPTATATPLPTVTPTPTATVDRQATVSARVTATRIAREAEVVVELEKVGFKADSGTLVYDSKTPISMTLDSYNSYWPESVVTTALKDFVVHSDIQWDSTSGLAGCGIMLRAEDDLERGAQYLFDLMRLSGAPNWEIYYRKFNTWQNDIVSYRFDNAILDEPNSVNEVVLVVQGDLIQGYINGKKLREGRYAKLSEGGIAFLAWQESGETTCTFRNTWVWALNPPSASN